MSMTFWIPAAPTTPKRESCMCAQMAPSFFNEPEPDWDELAKHASADCWLCKGEGCFIEQESTAPSLNMSNANCRDVTELLGLGRDEGGSLSHEQALEVLRRALKALNIPGRAESIAREGFQEGRMIQGGTTVESVRARLMGVIKVLKYAVENQNEVVWG